jgi:hypothetical protein
MTPLLKAALSMFKRADAHPGAHHEHRDPDNAHELRDVKEKQAYVDRVLRSIELEAEIRMGRLHMHTQSRDDH